jgi:hypothetical protein
MRTIRRPKERRVVVFILDAVGVFLNTIFSGRK